MTSHQFAKLLLDNPDLPFNIGSGIKYLNRGVSIQGPFTFSVTDKKILMIDQNPVMGYTEEEKQEVFRICLDRANWKNPVDVLIEAPIFERITETKIQRILGDQIGGGIDVTHYPKKGMYRVTAPGYYVSIGG